MNARRTTAAADVPPVATAEVEDYTDERAAGFLLTNAVDAADYARLRRVVADDFGLDPDAVDHDPPPGVARPATPVTAAEGGPA